MEPMPMGLITPGAFETPRYSRHLRTLSRARLSRFAPPAASGPRSCRRRAQRGAYVRFGGGAAVLLAARIPQRARRNRAAGGLALGRRPGRSVHAGREPDQMASRPCQLVFRAIL